MKFKVGDRVKLIKLAGNDKDRGLKIGDEGVVESQVNKALAEGAEAGDVMANGLIAGIGVVGKRFTSGEMFLPEVLLSTKVMHTGLDIINPLLAKLGQKGMGKVVIGTVAKRQVELLWADLVSTGEEPCRRK